MIGGVFTGQLGSAAAVMSTYAFAVLGAFLMTGRRTIDKRRVFTFALVTVVSTGVFLLGSRLLLGATMTGSERTATMFDRLRPSGAWGELQRWKPPPRTTGPKSPRRPGDVDLTTS